MAFLPKIEGSFLVWLNVMKIVVKGILCIAAISSLVMGDVIPEGAGIIYGDDHVFSLKAPKGWVPDNVSAADSGVHAVFYEKGTTWKDSKVVAYARSRPIEEKIKTVKEVVEDVVADFHDNGSPKYQGKRVKEIKLDSGKSGVVYHFSGDQWGNYEAVCYFKEKKTINFVVLSSRDKRSFEKAQPSFLALCQSYSFISDHLDKIVPEKIEATAGKETPTSRSKEMGKKERGAKPDQPSK